MRITLVWIAIGLAAAAPNVRRQFEESEPWNPWRPLYDNARNRFTNPLSVAKGAFQESLAAGTSGYRQGGSRGPPQLQPQMQPQVVQMPVQIPQTIQQSLQQEPDEDYTPTRLQPDDSSPSDSDDDDLPARRPADSDASADDAKKKQIEDDDDDYVPPPHKKLEGNPALDQPLDLAPISLGSLLTGRRKRKRPTGAAMAPQPQPQPQPQPAPLRNGAQPRPFGGRRRRPKGPDVPDPNRAPPAAPGQLALRPDTDPYRNQPVPNDFGYGGTVIPQPNQPMDPGASPRQPSGFGSNPSRPNGGNGGSYNYPQDSSGQQGYYDQNGSYDPNQGQPIQVQPQAPSRRKNPIGTILGGVKDGLGGAFTGFAGTLINSRKPGGILPPRGAIGGAVVDGLRDGVSSALESVSLSQSGGSRSNRPGRLGSQAQISPIQPLNPQDIQEQMPPQSQGPDPEVYQAPQIQQSPQEAPQNYQGQDYQGQQYAEPAQPADPSELLEIGGQGVGTPGTLTPSQAQAQAQAAFQQLAQDGALQNARPPRPRPATSPPVPAPVPAGRDPFFTSAAEAGPAYVPVVPISPVTGRPTDSGFTIGRKPSKPRPRPAIVAAQGQLQPPPGYALIPVPVSALQSGKPFLVTPQLQGQGRVGRLMTSMYF